MKICVINSLFAPYSRGGAEVLVVRIVDELKKKHDVSVITTCPWSGFRSLLPSVTTQDGIRIFRFFPLNIFSFISIDRWPVALRLVWHAIDLFGLHSFFVVTSILARERPDVVLTHNLKGMGYMSVRALTSSSLFHIHTIHDAQLYTPSGLIIAGQEKHWMHASIFSKLYRMACRWIFGTVKYVISPSHYLAHLMVAEGFFPKAQLEVIRNPIEYAMSQEEVTHKTEPFRFLYLGQLEWHKGIDTLLTACTGLEGDWQLTLVGQGSLAERIRALTKTNHRIHHRDFVADRNEINAIIRSSRFVVVPTLCYENSPLVVIESLAQGIPVIVSKIGGAAEMVVHGENGYCVAPKNPEDLRQVLVQAMGLTDAQYADMQGFARQSVKDMGITRYIDRIFSKIPRVQGRREG